MTVRQISPGRLHGTLLLPGDKSISHRAFIFAALCTGESRIRGSNAGEDVSCTRTILEALGARSKQVGECWHVEGVGLEGLQATDLPLNCGNSGTTMRLLMGLLAAQPFSSTLDGDASLRTRPMERVAKPLRTMGAHIETSDRELRTR